MPNSCLPYDYNPPISTKPVKYPITPEAHIKIKNTYKTNTGSNQVNILADQLQLPRWKVSRYAIRQGWIAKQKKAPNWTDPEKKILERNAHLTPERIQLRLKMAGYRRSTTGIVLKRKRMRLLMNLRGYTARSLAECLGVDVHFVTRAIRHGKLKAKKRGTRRTAVQGGDMWWIMPGAIREYILDCLYEIDIRKVDKYWFVDLMVNRDF